MYLRGVIMKYYYISHEGPFRNNLVMGKDLDRVNRDKNKIIITRINGSFHVLICKNGVYEQEKQVLSYFELVNFLKKIAFNAYFLNISGETAYFINSYVKKDDEVNRKEVVPEKVEPFYAINDGKMLKLEAYIKRDVIRDSINMIYEREIQDEEKCQELSLMDFIQNEELFELYHLPFREKGGHFLVPNYSYARPKPFYILSGIYDKSGDVISLSSSDLMNIYMIGNVEKKIVSDIINNIEVKVIKEYGLDSVNSVVEFLDAYHNNEDEHNISERLKRLREHLTEAKDNMPIVDSLDILKRIGEAQNILKKD